MSAPKAGGKAKSESLEDLVAISIAKHPSTLGQKSRWGSGAVGNARPWMAWIFRFMPFSCPEPCEAQPVHTLGNTLEESVH